MLIATLVVLNVPVYLLIGWLVFDTKEDAAETFFETIVAILKAIFVPRIVLFLMSDGEEEDGTWGIVPILAFFAACGLLVYGEYYLITRLLLR